MDHATLEAQERGHPGWRLLAADHAPLVVGFLYATFIRPNVRSMPRQELVARLDDHLYQLRAREVGEAQAYPRSAGQYRSIAPSRPRRVAGLSDMTVPVAELAAFRAPICRVFITENEVHGLPSPRGGAVRDAVARIATTRW